MPGTFLQAKGNWEIKELITKPTATGIEVRKYYLARVEHPSNDLIETWATDVDLEYKTDAERLLDTLATLERLAEKNVEKMLKEVEKIKKEKEKVKAVTP